MIYENISEDFVFDDGRSNKTERGCVRSTSRSSIVECHANCGWVCDHSRAPASSQL
jgi:microsomal dipeptidase-like Zn-dependent dipeptidase